MKKLVLCLAFLTSVSLATTLRAQVDDDSVDPIPEPASFALLGMGLAGLVGYKLYSKRR